MKIFQISRDKAGCVRLVIEGEITSRDFQSEDAKNPLETVMGSDWAKNKILIDLAKLTFIDSTAIGWMIESQRKSKAAGGKLVMHSATPRVREVFDLLKLGVVLHLMDDEASAKKAIGA